MSHLVLTPFQALRGDGARREDTPQRRVFVDRDGRVVVGDDAASPERRRLAEIPPAVFA